jgi:dCTP diphosphatase
LVYWKNEKLSKKAKMIKENYRNDEVTTLKTLKEEIKDFVVAREWGKFHNPKDLAISITIEASELLENFQWLSVKNSNKISLLSRRGQNISEELADVIIYCFLLGMYFDMDISKVILSKLQKNKIKYPIN